MLIYRRLTFCFKSIYALRKSYLRSTMGPLKLSNIAIINIEKSYANRIFQKSMDRIIDTFGKRKKIFNTCTFDGICTCFNYFCYITLRRLIL